MNTVMLFISTVLIWGTTWIAITFQVGDVPVLAAVFHRFALAGALMLVGLALMRRLKRPAQWRFVVVQALCLFCFNFIAFYNAATLIPSGLVSVVFSLATIFNAINARIFYGDRVTPQVVLAGVIGAVGVLLLFWHDLFTTLSPDSLRGILWATLGTLMFSFGNMASRKNTLLGVSPVTANAWGMGIGALALLLLSLFSGQTVTLPHGAVYWAALSYLALIGSVIGFTTYLLLVQRIGSAKAAYATVVFPVIALILSTVFEGYQWTPVALAGVGLTILGNIVMFAKR